uniref:Mesothelin like n=1 Tax=Phocoena sinus TaxID=42100 RepID=A0A8C9C011_PHOSS
RMTSGALVSPGLAFLVSLTAHCSHPQAEGATQGGLDVSRANLWASANTSLLQGFWCQPASQLARDQLAALIRRMETQHVLLGAWQLSCLANLATRQGLQGNLELHPTNLLLTQVREADCQAFVHRTAQGNTGLLANLPDQRATLRHRALACLGGPRPRLSTSDLLLLGVLVCDTDASSIMAADPHVLQNLRRCPQLMAALTGWPDTEPPSHTRPSGSWNLEGLQALGPVATDISPSLWMQLQEAVGLDFFGSIVAKAKLVPSQPKWDTGRPCIPGNITAATLHDGLFLVCYDCVQLKSCPGSRACAQGQPGPPAAAPTVYPGSVPEEQLQLIPSLAYLYSHAEIGQWHITSKDTVVALLAPDGALENQTEVILQKFLDHNGTITSALLVANGGSRLCWMSPRQIQAIQPLEFWLAGALDISSCPQSRKNVLYDKAREAFGTARTVDEASPLIAAPPLGGAPVEELRHLPQANVSVGTDTFTSLNTRVLLSMGNVTTLLGQNMGDLQKAHSHPTISSWLCSLNRSALGELGLDTDPTAAVHGGRTAWGIPAGLKGAPSMFHLQAAHLGYLPLAVALPSGLLWLLYWSTLGPSWNHSQGTCPMASKDSTAPAPLAGKPGLVGGAGCLPRPRCLPHAQGTWPRPASQGPAGPVPAHTQLPGPGARLRTWAQGHCPSQ